MPISPECVEQAYKVAKKVFEGTISTNEAVEYMYIHCGMNKGTTRIFIAVFPKMVDGEGYKYGLAGMPTRIYLTQILNDKGKAGLTKALQALMGHIDYYESRRSVNMHGLRAIHEEFSKKL